MTGERREQEKRGGPDSEKRSLSLDRVLEDTDGHTVAENSRSSGGCRRCSARGVALLDPCMAVVDGGVHELVAVSESGPCQST